MTDKRIIELLIERDANTTRQFFFKDCRPLFVSIIRNVFTFSVDYDEFVNEFYLYLMENEGYRLKQFEGRSTIYQWLKVVAIRYFIGKRERLIENDSKESLLEKAECKESSDDGKKSITKIDVNTLLNSIPNKRYAYVIKRLMLEDAEYEKVAKELNITVDNLYNIKKRAITALTKIALKEAK